MCVRCVALRNPIRTTRYDNAKFVSVRIGQHDPADPTFAYSPHEFTAELESPFGNVVGIVRVKVNVASPESEIINVAALKRDVRTST